MPQAKKAKTPQSRVYKARSKDLGERAFIMLAQLNEEADAIQRAIDSASDCSQPALLEGLRQRKLLNDYALNLFETFVNTTL